MIVQGGIHILQYFALNILEIKRKNYTQYYESPRPKISKIRERFRYGLFVRNLHASALTNYYARFGSEYVQPPHHISNAYVRAVTSLDKRGAVAFSYMFNYRSGQDVW